MAKTGRKPPAKATKDDIVRLRISTDHKRALEAAAAREGLELSAWLRRIALIEAGVLPQAK
jgi:uncharacterized protein (DUF1778 family)